MPTANALMQRLGLQHPIIQAPMAGGGDTPDLVVASAEAGAVGVVGGAYLTAEQIAATAESIRARTNRGFGINLFAPQEIPPLPAGHAAAMDSIAPYFRELELPAPAVPDGATLSFEAQFEALLHSGASVFSFTFGIPPLEAIAAARARGMTVLGTATTVAEALALERAGVDAVVAQGSEAGGHRGTFIGDFQAAMIGTMALVPQIVDAVGVPVIASGGIMDGRGIAAALVLGASAVQMGTAFLATAEAGIAEPYKQAIRMAPAESTAVTRAFSGRPARGIRNRFMQAYEAAGPDAILPFPYQNSLTRPMRTAAGKLGKTEYLSLWAGQGAGMARPLPAAILIEQLAEEAEAALRRAAG